jgi:hypothetical protein
VWAMVKLLCSPSYISATLWPVTILARGTSLFLGLALLLLWVNFSKVT